MIGALIGGRVSLTGTSLEVAKLGLTIAVRYAMERTQFGPPKKPEIPNRPTKGFVNGPGFQFNFSFHKRNQDQARPNWQMERIRIITGHLVGLTPST